MHIHIRQKVHFNCFYACALTGFTTTAFDIKAKSAGLITAYQGLWCFGEQLANFSKNACVGYRITSRGTANGRLVDVNYFVNVCQTFD